MRVVRRFVPLAGLLLAATGFAQDRPARKDFESFKDKEPPDLVSEPEAWINSKKLTFKDLRGLVVLYEYASPT